MMTTMTVVVTGGLGILTVALVTATVFRRASASLRHLVWLAALSAALALPALEGTGVELPVTMPGSLVGSWSASRAPDDARVENLAVRPASTAIRATEAGGSADSSGERLASTTTGPPATTGSWSATRSSSAVGPSRAAGSSRMAGSSRAEERSAERGGAARGAVEPGGSGPARSARLALPEAGSVAVGIWMAGTLLLLGGTLSRTFEARSLVTRDVAPASSDARRALGRVCRRLGLNRPIRLVVSPRVEVPATWGLGRHTVVLPLEYTSWTGDTLHRVLLHELAHIQRRDCGAYLIGELARAVHWPNPLAWLALQRLRSESERACDDRVLEIVDLPSDYAGDLVTMVRGRGRRAPLPSPALAMARLPGLSVRVRAILDPTQSRDRVGRTVGAVVASVATMLALFATVVVPVADAQEPGAPTASVGGSVSGPEEAAARTVTSTGASGDGGPSTLVRPTGEPPQPTAPASTQEAICVFRESGGRSMSTHIDDDEIRIRWETDDCRVEIDMEGGVEFSSDDREIVSMAPGSRFEIEERLGDDVRRARIEGGPGDRMERRYWEDGDELEWGPEADRWLASLLPQIFRHSTINAEARVGRMLDDGGPDRVFEEVRRIPSDHVARRYLEIMIQTADLGEEEYRRVIEAAGNIESDHGSAALMMSVIERAGLRPSFQEPLLTASERLDSDHQRTRVLLALLESPLSASQFDAVLTSASSIDSDHNLGKLLSLVARAGRLDEAGRTSFLGALRSIESDHRQAEVIHAFLDSGTLSDDELTAVLAMSHDIDSDHQRAGVLQRVARDYPLTGGQVTAYLESAARIGSDHQKATTAMAVIDRAGFDGEQLRLALRIADDIDSDHQRSQTLRRIVERRTLSPAELSGLLAVARGIDSDHNLGELLSLLLELQELDDDGLVEALETLATIDSDHQRAEVLIRAADRYRIEGRARSLYRSLADGLSDRQRDRALAAIVR